MDQPFRPTHYLHHLRRHWLLIIIPAVVAVILALIIGFLTPVRYTATATLSAPNPQLIWRWDNRVTDYVDWRFNWRTEVLPLINTQEVAQRALDKVEGQLEEPMTAEQLLGATSSRLGQGSLFTISVSASNPQDAALLTQAVAASLPETVADLYAGNIDLYTEALEQVQSEFDIADETVKVFRGDTGIGLGFGGDLASLGEDELFGAHSAIKQELTLANSDRAATQNLVDRLDVVIQAIEDGDPEYHLALLDVAHLSRYGLQYEGLRLLAEQDTDSLQTTIRSLRGEANGVLEQLNMVALDLQHKHAAYSRQWENILQERGIWLESVTSLERKQVELQMKRIIEGERVQVIDEPTVPETPSQPNWLLYLGIALLGGLLGGFLLAIVVIYLSDANA
ncbi:MAG: hypothetical protein GY759_06885 [Chloroflexi bacterium]|nr:hypothetical protein [Chloroflexota bacterium]